MTQPTPLIVIEVVAFALVLFGIPIGAFFLVGRSNKIPMNVLAQGVTIAIVIAGLSGIAFLALAVVIRYMMRV